MASRLPVARTAELAAIRSGPCRSNVSVPFSKPFKLTPNTSLCRFRADRLDRSSATSLPLHSHIGPVTSITFAAAATLLSQAEQCGGRAWFVQVGYSPLSLQSEKHIIFKRLCRRSLTGGLLECGSTGRAHCLVHLMSLINMRCLSHLAALG